MNEVFEVTNESKRVAKIKAKPSKQCKRQFDIQLSNFINENLGENSCIVEPDKDHPKRYLIYSINSQSNEKTRFGEFHYELCNYDNYLYTIIIGQKLYKVTSLDLKDRRLVITDIFQPNNASDTNHCTRLVCPETLYQVIDSFSKLNHQYHVSIHKKEWALGYFAITILLHLHESQRNSI